MQFVQIISITMCVCLNEISKSILSAYLWQLMRCNMMQLLRNLRFHSHGKEINDADILEWANSLVKNSGGQLRMRSFKVYIYSFSYII